MSFTYHVFYDKKYAYTYTDSMSEPVDYDSGVQQLVWLLPREDDIKLIVLLDVADEGAVIPGVGVKQYVGADIYVYTLEKGKP